jgi:hypothetical protein
VTGRGVWCNDVVVHSDGSIWFTNPGYGILFTYEGQQAEFELPTRVYRVDAHTGPPWSLTTSWPLAPQTGAAVMYTAISGPQCWLGLPVLQWGALLRPHWRGDRYNSPA